MLGVTHGRLLDECVAAYAIDCDAREMSPRRTSFVTELHANILKIRLVDCETTIVDVRAYHRFVACRACCLLFLAILVCQLMTLMCQNVAREYCAFALACHREPNGINY